MAEGPISKSTVKQDLAWKGEIVRINRDLAQANIIIGGIGVARSNPDYYALTVMNYILGGGGFGSRLMEEIRTQRGLAYSVGSFFDPKKFQGAFQVVLQTKNASAREAIDLGPETMEQIRTGTGLEPEALPAGQKLSDRQLPHAFQYPGETGQFPFPG